MCVCGSGRNTFKVREARQEQRKEGCQLVRDDSRKTGKGRWEKRGKGIESLGGDRKGVAVRQR